jgi:GNAT superfamily N-acetyltransferase
LAHRIAPFAPDHEEQVLALSMAAWASVFNELERAVPSYVYRAFYPQGWRVRQAADVRAFLKAEGRRAWVAMAGAEVLGWVGIRLHPEDSMGELYILAVHPDHQRRGLAGALIDHAMAEMRRAGMVIVMVETGDDPGHAPSRATYERAGFERWPVARYFRKL